MTEFPDGRVPSWYALYVRARHEKVVATVLRTKGFETCLPMGRSLRTWGKRKTWLETPAFPGYVFCKFQPEVKTPIVATPGVVRIVGFGKQLIPLETDEISALQTLERTATVLEPFPFLRTGHKVRINGGPLDGLSGIMAHYRNSFRVVVSLTLLQRSVAVEIDRDAIESIQD